MNRGTIQVHFDPVGVTVLAHAGDTLLDSALENRIEIEHECGGNCACTSCQIYIEEGWGNLSDMEEVERDRLSSAEGLALNSRLACQAILTGGDMVVRIAEPA